MTDQALESLAEAAIALNQPTEALAALDAYPATKTKPAFLFLRAQAREQAGRPSTPSRTISFLSPLSDRRAGAAGNANLDFLRSTLKSGYQAIPLDQRIAHAGAFSMAESGATRATEYSQLLPQLSGADHERAELRILECGVALGGGVSPSLRFKSPTLMWTPKDFSLSRSITARLAGIADGRGRGIRCDARARTATGPSRRYFWEGIIIGCSSIAIARPAITSESQTISPHRPTRFLRSGASRGPRSEATPGCREPDAPNICTVSRIAIHARCAVLARPSRGRSGRSGLARAYYAKLADRYPQNYFASLAAARDLRALGAAGHARSR